jgi:hypothetical protein
LIFRAVITDDTAQPRIEHYIPTSFYPSNLFRKALPSAQPVDVNMAQDSEVPKAADKGKGKAVDDAKKDKQQSNGKKEDEKIESMRSSRFTRQCYTD